jgi:hypothetical protein
MKERHSESSGERKTNPFLEMAQQTVKNCEQALRNGLKLQEETGKWWNNMMSQTGAVQDWQKRFTSLNGMATAFMPAAQKRAEEMLNLAEKNARTSVDLAKKAADALQTPVIADSQAKWMEFWTASLGAVRSNSEALVQAGGHAIDAWVDFIKKNSEVTQIRVPKGA